MRLLSLTVFNVDLTLFGLISGFDWNLTRNFTEYCESYFSLYNVVKLYSTFTLNVRNEAKTKTLFQFQELQHEVSSLLVLKDALLETFPHLHQRITGIPQVSLNILYNM